MARRSCCPEGVKKGAWTLMEDRILKDYVMIHGEGKWGNVPNKAELRRCGKSCRLRWLNYLRPDIIRGNITPEEDDLIIRLHNLLGNRWALIAGRLPGRTDNEIKNYWNTTLCKKIKGGKLGSGKNSGEEGPSKVAKKGENPRGRNIIVPKVHHLSRNYRYQGGEGPNENKDNEVKGSDVNGMEQTLLSGKDDFILTDFLVDFLEPENMVANQTLLMRLNDSTSEGEKTAAAHKWEVSPTEAGKSIYIDEDFGHFDSFMELFDEWDS